MSQCSILAALDAILESSSQTLIVPTRKKQLWLTQEDFARFFLNNIFLFSRIAPQSITSLNLINTNDLLSIPHHSSALTALPLLRSALLHNTAVAVTTSDKKLIGEISPFTLSSGDETVAAAIATLSAGDLMSYIDCCSCSSAPDSFIQMIKARLHDKGLNGMLELFENEDASSFSSSCSVSSGSSSSSDEESASAKKRKPRKMKSSSYSARMGRKSEEAIVCHPESSLVAVLVQALAHRVSYVWVVDENDYGLVGIVTFHDVLKTFREQLSGV